MNSIGRQLGTGLVAILLITVISVGQGSAWLFDRALRGYLEDVLQREIDSLLAALEMGPDGLYLDQLRIDPDYRRPFSGRYFVIDASERWRSRSLWDQRLPLDGEGLRPELVDGPQNQQLLSLSGRYVAHGEPLTVTVALDYRPMLQSLARARWWVWGLGMLAITLSVALQQGLLQRALSPLRSARQQLAEWRSGQRVALDENVPIELRALVSEINHLGHQIEVLLKRSRSAVSDLGHGLKTPLAVIESTLARQAEGQNPMAIELMREQVTAMRGQLQRALQRAHLAPERKAGDWLDPARDLPWLIASLSMAHDDRVAISLAGDSDQPWPFDRDDMLELLGNLLDNACKWAGGAATLRWRAGAQVFELSVEDDGPGLSSDERSAALGRGSRLDESVEGQGLGLAIVKDLVEAYHGSLSLEQAETGGLLVIVRLPCHPSD
ncbi:Signal transduction histidine kinase [Halopseudomonas xinjiangensis]|uniref:histidine kinase n=1 Tax=Halopseudomonas xinjiangensis TaxID=487184 RepID=A0A1H1SGC8_9GAMM|nr:sensor histidine kinase [Halopseudomonas xinjiangensis]SDS47012.1 Signal transduction histidine kinase [Halopseudomonas xinjiangensis]